MSDIELHTQFKLAAVTVAPLVFRVVEAMRGRERPFENLALRVSLGDLHLANVGNVEIPIAVTVINGKGAPPQEIEIVLEAVGDQQLFPSFRGTLTTTALAPAESSLALRGNYEVPLGAIGRGLDATVLRGVAQKSLETFLEQIRDEVVRRVTFNEQDAMRAMLLNRTMQ